jgi:predicted kinase
MPTPASPGLRRLSVALEAWCAAASTLEAAREQPLRPAVPTLECVVLVGLPASGKTTFYQRRFAATHHHISKDLWPNTRNPDARQALALRHALASGISVVVDNTNPAVADRAAVITIARAFDARVVGFYFDASTRECVGRNRGRDGARRVPDVAIFTKASLMTVPSAAEGFDELYRVSILPNGEFDVRPL